MNRKFKSVELYCLHPLLYLPPPCLPLLSNFLQQFGIDYSSDLTPTPLSRLYINPFTPAVASHWVSALSQRFRKIYEILSPPRLYVVIKCCFLDISENARGVNKITLFHTWPKRNSPTFCVFTFSRIFYVAVGSVLMVNVVKPRMKCSLITEKAEFACSVAPEVPTCPRKHCSQASDPPAIPSCTPLKVNTFIYMYCNQCFC